VQFIDRGASLLLADPELASSYGGPIAVRGRKTGLVPDGALYRVRLVPQDRTIPRVQLRGVVRIAGQSQSLLARTARSIAGVVVRESGL
jgi:putative peptide zinc metalloprotease protein